MPKKLYESLGKRIAAARKEKGWGQTKLAESSGLTRGSIANIEVGRQRAPLKTLWRIGLALGVEPRNLVPAFHDLRPQEMPGVESLDDPDIGKFIPPGFENDARVKAFIFDALGG